MATLASVLRLLALQVCETYTGTATGGSTTALADTTNLTQLPDDYLNGGVIFFLSGNNSGKTAVITDFTSSSGTITFATQSGACALGDKYLACHRNIDRTALVNAINLALLSVGRVPKIDATLTGTTDTIEHTLPTGIYNVKRVRNGVAGSEEENYWWEEVNGKLRFKDGYEPATGDVIQLYYIGYHADVSLDADVVHELVPIDTLVKVAAVEALQTRYGVTGDDDPRIKAKLSAALAQKQEALRFYRAPTVPKTPRLSNLGD